MGFCCWPPSYRIRRGTTPVLKFTLPTRMYIEDVSVAFQQNKVMLFERRLKQCGMRIEEDQITVALSQEETLKFKANMVAYIQVTIKDKMGFVTASDLMRLEIEDSVRKDVM